MFQKKMDEIQQRVLNTICYIDDILVAGQSDGGHLETLDIELNYRTMV